MSTTTRPRLPSIRCPHCNSRSIVRRSEQITETYRELGLNCTNDECGATFVASLSIIRQVQPSLNPNADVTLPFGQYRLGQRPRPANDDAPDAANDDERGGAAASDKPMSG